MTEHTMPTTRPRALARMLAVIALLTGLVVAMTPAMSSQALASFQDFVVSDDPTNTTPYVLDNKVSALAEVGNLIVVGGAFSEVEEVNGGVINQPYLFAFDRDTGEVSDTFLPTVSGEIEAIVPTGDGSTVFIGGRFNTVNGTTRRRVARVNVFTGALDTSFTANANSRVLDMQLRGDTLFLGGAFTSVNGDDRVALAAVDADTGDVLDTVNHEFAEAYGGRDGNGTVLVLKFDVSPDGTRLVAVGNFRTVDGEVHENIVQLDTGADPSEIFDWSTPRFWQVGMCASVFDTYMRDVQISPDGSWFNVNTTGAFRRDRLCDTSSRWELDASGSGQQPTWASYTGGDTLYANSITGPVVYIGGHQRWVNNPYAGDAQGPGGVPRDGLSALSAVSGLPFSWNPGRQRGVGVFDMLPTDEGIFMGSNTQRWAGEYHPRLALFPEVGGTTIPEDAPGPLPGTLLQAPLSTVTHPAFLYRVNAGGPALGAADQGIDWAADNSGDGDYRNSGSRNATWGSVPVVNPDVPEDTPAGIYSSERWDPGSAPELEWDFPVDAGREVEVRLYVSNRCTCTDQIGERVFDITVDGTVVADDLDLVATYGHDVGAVITHTLTSDGNVDIDFGHVVENTLINAIEIIDPALLDVVIDTSTDLESQDATTTSVGAASVLEADTDWSQVRGAWMLSGSLYTGMSDGTLLARDWDGTEFGAPRALELYGLEASYFPVSTLSGATYDPYTNRLYYTLRGDNQLHWRHFEDESGVVGAEGWVAQGSITGLDWSQVRGLHLDGATGTLMFGNTDGVLRSVDFSDGQAQAGTIATVADADGGTWNAGGITTLSDADEAVANVAPVAQVSSWCDDEGACTFGSVGSSDVDGTIVDVDWDFGDGGIATGPGAAHTFAQGTWQVTLTVTDDDGAPATATTIVTVDGPEPQPPVAAFSVDCDELSCTFDGSSSTDPDSTIVDWAWDFGDGSTGSGEVVTHDYTTDVDVVVSLTVTDAQALEDTAVTPVPLGAFPEAAFSADCTDLSCTFDGSASSDLAGDIVAWDWDFGDGTTGTGETTSHDYAQVDVVTVELTVTDDEGLTATTSQEFQVGTPPQAPVAAFDADCTDLTCTFDATASDDPDGSIVDWSWDFGDTTAGSGEVVDHTYGTGGSFDATLTVTDDDGMTDSVTMSVTVGAEDIAFVAATTVKGNRTSFAAQVPAGTQVGDALLLFTPVNRSNVVVSPPAGWTEEAMVLSGTLQTTVWSKVATADDLGSIVPVGLSRRSKAVVSMLAYTGTDEVDPVHAVALAAEGSNSATHTTPEVTATIDGGWVVSHWADKTTNTTDIAPPAGESVRAEDYTVGGGHISALASDHGPVGAGVHGGLTATHNSSNAKATMATIILAPGS